MHQIRCYICRAEITVDEPKIGKVVRCPKCSSLNSVSAAAIKTPAVEKPRPARTWSVPKQWVLVTFMILAAIAQTAGLAFIGDTILLVRQAAARARTAHAQSQGLSKLDVWLAAQGFVRAELDEPRTADFEVALDGNRQDPEGCVIRTGATSFRVRGWVAYQEADGSTTRREFLCALVFRGDDEWECERFELRDR